MIPVDVLLLKVRQAVNEASTTGDDFSKEVDAALLNFVELSAPLLVIQAPPAYQIADSVVYDETDKEVFFVRPDGMTAIRIAAPEDFCRFVSLKAASWVKPETVLYADTHPLFQNQYTIVPGIGAGPFRPRVFLSSELNSEGMPNTHIIGHSTEGPEKIVFSYVKTPSVSDTEVNMDERLQDALAYYAAGLYLQSLGDVTGSQAAADTGKSLVENLNNIAIV